MNADKRRIDSSIDLLPVWPISQQWLFTDLSGKPGHVNERLMCVELLKKCMDTSPHLLNTCKCKHTKLLKHFLSAQHTVMSESIRLIGHNFSHSFQMQACLYDRESKGRTKYQPCLILQVLVWMASQLQEGVAVAKENNLAWVQYIWLHSVYNTIEPITIYNWV